MFNDTDLIINAFKLMLALPIVILLAYISLRPVSYTHLIGMAMFENPGGLEKLGGNTYRDSRNSGVPQFGNPSQDGFGVVRQGNLEMSNVDLANEFTEMIITSRAFQANSRTITTSDEMLQELINLKR